MPGSSLGFTLSICFILAISEVQATPLFSDQCASVANNTNGTILLDQYGLLTTNQSEAWGIPYEACNALCGPLGGPGTFDWNFFSQGLSQWLLPWLALTAQLPFETKDKQSNFVALLLAVGSPALIVYSLALTILNSRSINREFRQIKEIKGPDVHPQQTKVIKAARTFLIESQHIPIQIYNGSKREFAQLIVNPDNWAWWCNLREEVRKTKRRWTYSLYIQVAWVCLSQFWAIVAFFTSGADNSVIGNALAINCLWIWMIPVVLGWVYVGTQSSAGSIKAALSSVPVPILGTQTNVRGECIGIRDRTTFNSPRMRLADPSGLDNSYMQEHNLDGTSTLSQGSICGLAVDDSITNATYPEMDPIHRNSQTLGMFSSFEPFHKFSYGLEDTKLDIELVEYGNSRPKSTNDLTDVEQQAQAILEEKAESGFHSDTFLGFSIQGADLEPGPIHNYARFWSHMNAVNHVVEAFTSLTQRQKREQTVHGRVWNPAKGQLAGNLEGSPEMMSKYISVDYKDVVDIPVHVNKQPVPVMNCFKAAFVAIALQWGSTGSALLIAYRYLVPFHPI